MPIAVMADDAEELARRAKRHAAIFGDDEEDDEYSMPLPTHLTRLPKRATTPSAMNYIGTSKDPSGTLDTPGGETEEEQRRAAKHREIFGAHSDEELAEHCRGVDDKALHLRASTLHRSDSPYGGDTAPDTTRTAATGEQGIPLREDPSKKTGSDETSAEEQSRAARHREIFGADTDEEESPVKQDRGTDRAGTDAEPVRPRSPTQTDRARMRRKNRATEVNPVMHYACSHDCMLQDRTLQHPHEVINLEDQKQGDEKQVNASDRNRARMLTCSSCRTLGTPPALSRGSSAGQSVRG